MGGGDQLSAALPALIQADQNVPLDRILTRLEERLCLNANLVVCENIWLNYPNRTEFYADEHGRFDEEMRTSLRAS